MRLWANFENLHCEVDQLLKSAFLTFFKQKLEVLPVGEPGRRRLAEERLAHLERSGEAWALLQEFHLAGGGGGEDAASRWAGIGEK